MTASDTEPLAVPGIVPVRAELPAGEKGEEKAKEAQGSFPLGRSLRFSSGDAKIAAALAFLTTGRRWIKSELLAFDF